MLCITPTRSVTPSTSSTLFSETNYGYDTLDAQDACDDQGTNPTIYSNIEWTNTSTPILYFNSSGGKRAAAGWYARNNVVKYYGTTGTWGSSGQICSLS